MTDSLSKARQSLFRGNLSFRGVSMTGNPFDHYSTTTQWDGRPAFRRFLEKNVPLFEKVTEINFEWFAEEVFFYSKIFAGTETDNPTTNGVGGAAEDIRVVLAAGFKIPLFNDFYTISARKPCDNMVTRIRKSIKNNNIDDLIGLFCGEERNATKATVKYCDLEFAVEDLESFYEMQMEAITNPTAVVLTEDQEVWIEEMVVKETLVHVHIGGNRWSRKPGKKPPTRIQKSFDFSGVKNEL